MNGERRLCQCSQCDARCLIGQAELPKELAGSPKMWHCNLVSHLGHRCGLPLINRFSRKELADEQWLRQWMDRVELNVSSPPVWQKKTHHVPKGHIYWAYQRSQRMTKGQLHGIFLWPLRCGNDQIWPPNAHGREWRGIFKCSPGLDAM